MHFQPGHITELMIEPVHRAALFFMVVVYILRIRTVVKAAAAEERTPARGNHAKAIAYSYGILAMPWEIEGYRKHPIRFVEFVLFHAGAAAAIGYLFAMPAFPAFIDHPVVNLSCRIASALALLAGCARLLRRILNPAMRIISSPDDYFSLLLLNAWFLSAILAAPMRSEPAVVSFYILAVVLHVYVPFSKIAHYIFWPFSRYYVGRHLGHRGVYPRKAMSPVANAG
jgi:nitrate reductase gamma subunit